MSSTPTKTLNYDKALPASTFFLCRSCSQRPEFARPTGRTASGTQLCDRRLEQLPPDKLLHLHRHRRRRTALTLLAHRKCDRRGHHLARRLYRLRHFIHAARRCGRKHHPFPLLRSARSHSLSQGQFPDMGPARRHHRRRHRSVVRSLPDQLRSRPRQSHCRNRRTGCLPPAHSPGRPSLPSHPRLCKLHCRQIRLALPQLRPKRHIRPLFLVHRRHLHPAQA